MKFNPKHQYGDYVMVSGHGYGSDHEEIKLAAKLHKEQRDLIGIPAGTQVYYSKQELWVADSDAAGEHKGSLWPRKLKGVEMVPVTVLGWKTIPTKRPKEVQDG